MSVKVAMIVMLAAVAAPASARRQSVDPLDDLFARGRAIQASIQSVSASFTETTRSSLLVRPIVATGTLVAAVKPIRVVMRYAAPDARSVWIDEQTLLIAWADRPRVEQVGIAAVQRRVQKYFAEASPKELRANFDMTLTTDAGPPPAHVLEMTPKRKQIKEGLQRLRIWIDRQRLLMIKMQMDFPGGDSKTIELSDPKTNVPVDDATFARPRSGRGGSALR